MKMKMTYKQRTLIMYLAFVLIFAIYLLIGTSGSAPYRTVAFSFGSFEVAWYATFILTGIVFAFLMALNELKRFKMNTDFLYDGILITVPLAVIAARLHWVIFNLDKINNFGDIFNFQSGGLGIHGAVIVTFLFLIYFAKRKKVSYFFIMELVVPGFLIAQAIGRWGNFMNQELYGPILENASWLPKFIADQMYIAGNYYHPVFLYESIFNIVGFILLITVVRKLKFYKIGDSIAYYLVWYGLVRIPVELLRIGSGVDEPLKVLGLYVSVWISVLFIVIGVLAYILKRKKFKNLPRFEEYSDRAVILDLDGTVLDTTEIIVETFKQTFRELLPDVKLTESDYTKFIGPTLSETFSKYTNDNEKVNKLIKHYQKISEEKHEVMKIKPFDGVDETIKYLKKQNFKVAIVSSKSHYFVRLGLENANLIEYIDLIIGNDDVTEHKPSGMPIQKALDTLNVYPGKTCYVGDHPSDIISARNAGIPSVLVSYSLHYQDALANQPDYVVKSFGDILNITDEFN